MNSKGKSKHSHTAVIVKKTMTQYIAPYKCMKALRRNQLSTCYGNSLKSKWNLICDCCGDYYANIILIYIYRSFPGRRSNHFYITCWG